jgi:hypothetical protein
MSYLKVHAFKLQNKSILKKNESPNLLSCVKNSTRKKNLTLAWAKIKLTGPSPNNSGLQVNDGRVKFDNAIQRLLYSEVLGSGSFASPFPSLLRFADIPSIPSHTHREQIKVIFSFLKP